MRLSWSVLLWSLVVVGCRPAQPVPPAPQLPPPTTQLVADSEARGPAVEVVEEPVEQPADQPKGPPVVQPVVVEPPDGQATGTEAPSSGQAGATDVPDDPTTDTAATEPTAGEEPATRATEPVTTQAAESPKAALAGIMNATVRGDVEGVRQRLFVEGDEAARMAAAMVEVAEAAKRVRDASAAKFGWDNLTALDIEIVPPLLLAGATEQVDAERATVQFPGQAAGTVMRQVNGGWKLSVPDLVAVQKRTRAIDQVIDEAREPAWRLDALARRVEAGEFETIEQVQHALAQSLFAAGETVKKE